MQYLSSINSSLGWTLRWNVSSTEHSDLWFCHALVRHSLLQKSAMLQIEHFYDHSHMH